MLCLFRPLKEYVAASILTVGTLHFVFLLGCMSRNSVESLYSSVRKIDVSPMILVLEF
jgi:hypothetical protein